MNPHLVSNLYDVTRSRLVSVSVDMSITDVAKKLLNTQISLVVVCDTDGVMVGIVTKTDIVRWLGQCQGSSCAVCAGDVMIREVIFCHPADYLPDVLSLLQKHCFVHLPVLDENHRPSGVLNARDALKVLYADERYEESLLRDYVMGIGYQ